MTWTNIVDDLIEDFRAGRYEARQKLPSENKLVDKYNVTRHDVRKALDNLTEQGYIYSIPGKGRYLKKQYEKIPLLLVGSKSFTDKMLEDGFDLKTELIEFEQVDKPWHWVEDLVNGKDEKIYKVVRLRIIDNEPAALHISYVSDRLFKNIALDGPSIQSLFAYYREHGFSKFYYKKSQLQTTLPPQKQRALLHCPPLVPIIELESQCYDELSDTLLEVTRIIYRGDRFNCIITP